MRIKICGITTEADSRLAAALGADMIGLNFYSGSPRCIDLARAEAIVRELPPFVDAVGLFVNLPVQQVVETLQHLDRVRTIQWHGESRDVCDPSPCELIRAFSVRDCTDLKSIQDYLDRCRSSGLLPRAILVDAHVPGLHGGTGQTAPWSLLADFQPGVPLILAGGLTPENVAEAIRIVRPSGVDVASGVERTPGRKDGEKLRRFVANAREAAAKWN